MEKLNKMKIGTEKRGITLISLVITIVVMLILVGVTINLTLGQNGIFKTAQIAAKNYTETQEKEQAELKDFESMLSNVISGGEEILNGSWSEKNKVNKPNLVNTGLTAVTINGNGTYGVPDIEKDSWYSYDGVTNKWANARTKDGSLWVWVPRFAYKITYKDETNKTSGGKIDVVFLQGTTNLDCNGKNVTASTYVDESGATGAYIVHPAFQDGSDNGYANGEWDKEIPGFWMAKFEAGYTGNAGDANSAVDSNIGYTSTLSWITEQPIQDLNYNYYGERAVGIKIKYPTFQANRASVNHIWAAEAYDLCMDIKNATHVYGLKNMDSHMTKNSEWGAVAYLAYSKYGTNGKEVVLNNVSLNNSINTVYAVTGYAATSATGEGANKVITTWDKIQNGTQDGNWLTVQGQTASTTGNIYGIYDMSGGVSEWTSGYIASEGNYEVRGGNIKGESNKYKSKYSGVSETATDNYNENINTTRLGEAIWETSTELGGAKSWNTDGSVFLDTSRPFTLRGGTFTGAYRAGMFYFAGEYGAGLFYTGFRAILIAK